VIPAETIIRSTSIGTAVFSAIGAIRYLCERYASDRDYIKLYWERMEKKTRVFEKLSF
jgi:hypothetical protein